MIPDISVYMIDSWESFVDLQHYVAESNFEIMSLDLETDSLVKKKALIYGAGLSFKDNEAFYIKVRLPGGKEVWTKEQLTSIYYWIASQCECHKLIGHNIIYDVLVFENNSGFVISNYIYSDTILLKHSIDEMPPHGLKETAVKYLGPWADKAQQAMYASIEANGGKTTKEDLQMHMCDPEVLGEYCGWDVVLTRKLFDLFEPQLKEQGLWDLFYKEEIMPLYREVTIPMERSGFPVDVEYFKNLKDEISQEIVELENKIFFDIESYVKQFESNLLDKDYPVSTKGNFPKVLASIAGVNLPKNKNGAPSLAKKAIEKEMDKVLPGASVHDYYLWLASGNTNDFITTSYLKKAQEEWYYKSNPDSEYIFNLSSNDHLGWIFFSHYGEKPLSKTEGGKPQCNEEFLDHIKDKYKWVQNLIDYKKLNKLLSTYIDGILEREIDGVIYSSFLQFGTTSGRYSSRDPNLQNLPRIKDEEAELSPIVLKYVNSIKKGFVAPKGYVIVNADYSSLEPMCFAHVSEDDKLREVFRRGYDLYSQIAIDVFGLTDCSANKKAANYLGKLHKEKRQLAKIFCLAVVYGAEAGRISQAIGVDYTTAEMIIENYLDAYPNLRKYMARCDMMAKKLGYVKTDFGRIRHLPGAKYLYDKYGDKILNRNYAKQQGLGEVRYKLKNNLNNGKNFPIQGLAAHLVNRSSLNFVDQMKKNGITGYICAQVHDEITCLIKIEDAEKAKSLLKDSMENTTKISIPLKAEPVIGKNWAEAK